MVRLAAVLSVLWSFWLQATPQPVVHAVLFYSPGCSFCQAVMDRVFPPLETKYGARLDILKVPLSSIEDVDRLFASAAAYNLKKEDIAVPFLVVGSQVLVGEAAIEGRFAALIDQGLARGGIPAPQLPPPLAEAAALLAQTPTARPADSTGLGFGPQPAGAVTPTAAGCGVQGGCSPADFATPVPAARPNSIDSLLIAAGGLAVLLIVGGGVWYFISSRSGGDEED